MNSPKEFQNVKRKHEQDDNNLEHMYSGHWLSQEEGQSQNQQNYHNLPNLYITRYISKGNEPDVLIALNRDHNSEKENKVLFFFYLII